MKLKLYTENVEEYLKKDDLIDYSNKEVAERVRGLL